MTNTAGNDAICVKAVVEERVKVAVQIGTRTYLGTLSKGEADSLEEYLVAKKMPQVSNAVNPCSVCDYTEECPIEWAGPIACANYLVYVKVGTKTTGYATHLKNHSAQAVVDKLKEYTEKLEKRNYCDMCPSRRSEGCPVRNYQAAALCCMHKCFGS